jgi:hypothetical protein
METNKIASTFYKHMMNESGRLDHTLTALALNKTMKTVDIYTIRSTNSLYPSRCLVLVYPRWFSRFALLILTAIKQYAIRYFVGPSVDYIRVRSSRL